jgi:hypothetical protein
MKLNKEKQIDFQSNAVFEGYDAKISQEDMHKLWDLLQDPYKNSIGAVVREYVSNSFDSHAEAAFIKESSLAEIRNEYSVYRDISDEEINKLKKQLSVFDNDAVHVTISKDDTGHFWATEDFGVGLSPDRVRDVFCSYLKSTKENTNNVIGAFGIGSKSGLSYTDVVHIRTRYNGTEYMYMLRKGEKSPRLDVIANYPTTERNGTQIKIYIKSVKRYDWSKPEPEIDRFEEECTKQLAYFDNVFFSGCRVENDYTIARGINWLKSSNGTPFDGLHMCLGKVAYPIDWDSLGIPKISLGIAIHFEIGELDIIQTREDVKYTPRTKKAILDKIEAVRTEFIDKYNNEIGIATTDFGKFLKNRGDSCILYYNLDGGFNFEVNLYDLFRSSSHGDVSKKFQNRIKTISFKAFDDAGITISKSKTNYDIIDIDYKVNSYLNSSGLKHATRSPWTVINSYNDAVYRIKGDTNPKKSKYIANELENSDVWLIRAKTESELHLKNYVKVMNLDWDDRANWRAKIKVFQKVLRDYIISVTESYDRVTIDPQWLKDNYGNRKTYDRSKILAHKLCERNWDYTRGWVKEYIVKGDITRLPRTLFIVGTKEQRGAISFMTFFYKKLGLGSKFLKAVYVAPTNVQHFEEAKNCITVENFRQQKPFIRVMTAYHILQQKKYETVLFFISESPIFEDEECQLNSDLNFVKELNSYLSSNKLNNERYRRMDDFMKDAYNYAKEEDIFDKDVIAKMDYLFEYLSDIPLINSINFKYTPLEDLAAAIYRFNKSAPKSKFKRLNPMFYINYNAQELEWMDEKQRSIIQKVQMR